ncbi:MAG: hypothetical protein ABFD21_03820 [Anaerolineaceae bacterium]
MAPQTRWPKLVGLRCRSTRPTTTFCWVALPLHPTYDHCFSTRPTTAFCRVALPLHPTYDCVKLAARAHLPLQRRSF